MTVPSAAVGSRIYAGPALGPRPQGIAARAEAAGFGGRGVSDLGGSGCCGGGATAAGMGATTVGEGGSCGCGGGATAVSGGATAAVMCPATAGMGDTAAA